MELHNADGFRLTVLNPRGHDPDQVFRDLPAPGEGAHPPINFHAFAACTQGAFHQNPRRALAENTPVLLLLRGDFRASERALADLKKHGRTVVVSLKETGLHQIAQQLCDRGRLSRFMKIVALADGCIATTLEAAEIYQSARLSLRRVAFIPTPYPVEDQRWKSYPEYLRDVARHKIVLQLDRSHVPGQVAGDALLCRIPCVGGDGAIERIAFSKTCGEGRTIDEIASMALDLLKNSDLRAAIVAESQERALERLSFQAVCSQLAKFFSQFPQD